ncbi:ROK family protein [Actinomyces vulturis]|uniref:ROK family protein n=1 Tax=Actinomyces vulturis TaxID=1857645 RepID=UPI00082ED433|nr:ROK family protein [Actinomyces vulturis]
MTQAAELSSTAPTHSIGIDVGGTTIKYVIADSSGQMVLSETCPTPKGADELVAVVANLVASLRQRVTDGELAPICTIETLAPVVGVDVPGIVDDHKGMAVLSVNLEWKNYPMAQRLEEALDGPVVFGHDVRCGAWAENRWGAGGDNTFYLALGTGIGAGLLLDGHPRVGGGWAGEIGQIIVPDPDRPGQTTVLERVTSAGGLAQRLAFYKSEDEKDQVIAAGALGVELAMKDGDKDATYVWNSAIEALAEAMAHAVCALGPLDIVIGGGLAKAGDVFVVPLREEIAKRLTLAPVPDVLAAALGSWSQALGSAGRALEACGVPCGQRAN